MPLNALPVMTLKKEKKLQKMEFQKKTCYGIKITQAFIDRITGPNSWLSSENINVYMALLADKSPYSIHVVDSGWFGQRLVRHSNPQELFWFLYELESSIKWLDSQYVIIPLNESGTHWTVVVIDTEIKKKYLL